MDQNEEPSISEFSLAGWVWRILDRDIPQGKEYIAGQKEHHRQRTFKELIEFLDEYGIAYDERYLWR